jgi:hypothetical protein
MEGEKLLFGELVNGGATMLNMRNPVLSMIENDEK